MQFRLADNPPVKGGVLFLLLVATIGETVILVAFLVTDAAEPALAAGISLLVMAVVVALSAWLMNRGVVKLTEEQLGVRTAAGKQLIEWADVAGARVRMVSQLGKVDRILAALAGPDNDRRLVEIELKRPFRFAILPWRQDGTDAIGLPALPGRRIRVYVSDPEGLVDAISMHLSRSSE